MGIQFEHLFNRVILQRGYSYYMDNLVEDLGFKGEEISAKVISAAYNLINEKGFIAPVELFMKIDILSKSDYEDWRMGRIPYLEKVCKVNLCKMSLIMKELRSYATKSNLKASFTAYKKWGKVNKINLRFSKYGDLNIEKSYSTHFINSEFFVKTKSNEGMSI